MANTGLLLTNMFTNAFRYHRNSPTTAISPPPRFLPHRNHPYRLFSASIPSVSWSTHHPFGPSANLSASYLYHTMGILNYESDNETRIIHFCRHLVIKDRVPENYDVVSGRWYVKEPAERGRPISASRAKGTRPPPEIPRLVFLYFDHQMRRRGHWDGW